MISDWNIAIFGGAIVGIFFGVMQIAFHLIDIKRELRKRNEKP